MNSTLLADLVVVVHLLFAVCVTVGFPAILLGWWRGWRWVRRPLPRLTHLGAIAFVGLEAVVGMVCPLTAWENQLRRAAGAEPELGAFIARWASRLLYYDFPPWVFTATYLGLTLLAILLLWLVPIQKRHGNTK